MILADTYSCSVLVGKELTGESHIHSNTVLVYILDGYADAFIMGKTYHLAEGDLCYSLGGEECSFRVEEHCTCCKLELSPTFYDVFLPDVMDMSPITHCIKKNEQTCQIMGCFQRLLAPIHQAEAEGCIRVILGHLLTKEVLVSKKTMIQKDDFLQQVEGYLIANYQRNFTISEMAKSLHCSVSTLSSLLNRKFQCGFREYINSFRIQKAKKELLEKPSESIVTVAVQSGFNSLRTFNRIFKQSTGMSPKEYRHRNLDATASPFSHDGSN